MSAAARACGPPAVLRAQPSSSCQAQHQHHPAPALIMAAATFAWGPWPELNDGCAYPPAYVSAADAAATPRALAFMASKFPGSGTRQEWEARLVDGQVVLADGTPLAPDTILRRGDALTHTRRPWREPDSPHHLHVLFEDEHVLVVGKPSGLQVLTRGLFCQRTVAWLLQRYHEQHRRARFPDSDVPVPVHRLGRGTSGVLLCACTEAARRQLSRDFQAATALGAAVVASTSAADAGGSTSEQLQQQRLDILGKQYRALVTGLVQQDEGRVEVPIGPVSYAGLPTGLFAASTASDAKPALSLYRVLHRHADTTLVEVTILTGRPHQIRIHMAALGHPLVGDPLYGPGGVPRADALSGGGAFADAGAVMPGDCGYHLHSMRLQFRHPATGQDITVTAPVPDALKIPSGA